MFLAIKVVNLRRALEAANRELVRAGKFGVLCVEDDGPTFKDGRKFWAEVRALEKADQAAKGGE